MNRKIVAWTLYDFADTSFSALFISFFFPILIKRYLGGTEFQIGLALGLSLLLTALLVPWIGALADAWGRRIPILITSTIITVVLTALTGYVGLWAALGLGFLANFFNTIDLDLYNSYLTDLAPPEKRGRLSGLGTAVGYLGTLGILAVAFLILSQLGFETKVGAQAMFPTVAIFYLLFSLPFFFLIRDRAKTQLPLASAARKAQKEVWRTLTHLGETRGLGPFLLASFIYNDALHTAIIFISLFGTERIGLSIMEFFGAFAIMALAAFAGSLFFGKLSDRFGPKRTLLGILVLWMAVIGLLISTRDALTFILAGSLGGAALGGTWTANRHLITRLSPPKKIAEIFGFAGLTEKVAGVLGPIGFGFLATEFGYSAGLVYLLIFFVVGFYILWRFVPALTSSR